MEAPGKLYIVATPIGNPKDITQRALEVLAAADAVVCEEHRQGSALLRSLGIKPKELVTINEHNEIEHVPDLVQRMLLHGQSLALISDCGTPVFADPGHELIRQAAEMGIQVVPVPGPSSLMAALSLLEFKLERFVFAGFLARILPSAAASLARYRAFHMPVVLMDTPYRLMALLQDVEKVFGKEQVVTLAADLTLPRETVYRGPVSEVLNRVNNRKAEFILILHR